ncbi:F0F1 ATP synthase subunit delta [Candidatus Spongiihabitans sp.]|uniref:F0F1 ATP synthase subunit delta n=1 Tax=Candidatus Spongiihabitans sp. TaxID=3101308 RepID=UPI003C7A6FDC
MRSVGDIDVSFPEKWFGKNIADISDGKISEWKPPLSDLQKDWHRSYWLNLQAKWKNIDYAKKSEDFCEWLALVDWFEWPSTVAPVGPGEMDDIPMPRVGLFSYLNYRVGQNGKPDDEREQILNNMFCNKLPRINSDEYMEEFDQPKSAMRLKKMADFLAAQARNYSRNQYSDYSTAISHYKMDLDYLYDKYYVEYFGFDASSGFPWPDCPTPEPKAEFIPTRERKPKRSQWVNKVNPPMDDVLPDSPSEAADEDKARELEVAEVETLNYITKPEYEVAVELKHIARPYARAVFELAQQQNDLAGWGERLNLLAVIAADVNMASIIGNPHVSTEQLQTLILEVAADRLVGDLNEQAVNLVKLLAHNGRIGALNNIARAFTALRSDAEKTVSATMATAVPINDAQQQQFITALQSKLGRRVNLAFEVDEKLIGGAVIRAGDLVVDGSVRAQLEQLGGALEA